MQDLRYAFRTLARTPGFTVVAILTLGLGIGATTAIFSVVHGVLMKPLPYRDPARLANIWVDLGVGNQSLPAVTPGDFLDYQQRAQLFEGFAAGTGATIVGTTGALGASDGHDTERVDVTPVTANFFPLLGVDPSLGRHFLPEEEALGGPQVAILSHRLWKRRFAGDPSIVGRTIHLDGLGHTVVGIMPETFSLLLPAEAFLVTNAQIWKPLRYDYSRLPPRNLTIFTVFARLKPGVTLAQAQTEMDGIGRQLRREHPLHESSDMRIRVVPLQHDIVKHAQPALLALFGAVGFVLLIACANVAHLLLTRATARQHELALRAALGARGRRLVRQLATESLVLASAGALVGLVLAEGSLIVLRVVEPAGLPRLDAVRMDGYVLAFTLVLTVLTAMMFGIVPALRAARQDLNRTLRASASLSATVVQLRLRNALVMGEVALAVVLLVGAGLMVRSFVRLQQVQPGFEQERVLTARLALPRAARSTPESRQSFRDELEKSLLALPGVTAVGLTSQLPLTGSGPLQPYAYDEETARNWESATSDRRSVSVDYFRAMGTRVLAGRVFTAHEAGGPPKIVIDDTLAAKAYPGQSAVGQKLQIQPDGSGGERFAEIIGVVEHMRILDLTQAVRPQVWTPMFGVGGTSYVVIRTDRDPASLVSSVRDTFARIEPGAAVDRIVPMSAYVGDGLGQARLSLALMAAFGFVALILAVVGVYGVISYSVGQRTREIGIRMALGAMPGRVRNTILAQGLKLIVPSLIIGSVVAVALSHFISGLLYETEAIDPVTFGATVTLMLLVGLAGCYIPARRATTINPVAAIRNSM